MGGGIGLGSILSLVGTFAGMMNQPSAPSAPAAAAPPPPPAPAPVPAAPEAPKEESNIAADTAINTDLAKAQAAQRRRAEQQKSLTVLNTSGSSTSGKSLLGE